jgi:hypothetical protein
MTVAGMWKVEEGTAYANEGGRDEGIGLGGR